MDVCRLPQREREMKRRVEREGRIKCGFTCQIRGIIYLLSEPRAGSGDWREHRETFLWNSFAGPKSKREERQTYGGQGHPFAEGCEEPRICRTDEIL